MYSIYSDGNLLYTPHLANAGCGVFSPKLTVELNRSGSLEFTLPPNNVLYNGINKLTSIITVYQDDEEMFRGRLLNDEKDFYNQKVNYCEGELAFLLDSKQRPYVFEGTVAELFKKYIEYHNTRVEAAKRFTVGNITVKDANEKISIVGTEYPSTIDEITENLLDYYGGYLKVRGYGSTRYIDWLEESGNDSSQTIEFRVNLLDLSEYISAENIFTVLIPIGKSLSDSKGNPAGYVNISSINDGKDYVEDATAISLFGRIESTETWSDVEDPAELKTLAEHWLSRNIELAVTLTVKAIDLSLMNVEWERIRLGDWLRVISLPHEMNDWFQCTKIVYDLVNPENNEYTFGIDYTSLTGKQASNEKYISKTNVNMDVQISAITQTMKEIATRRTYIVDIPTEGWITANGDSYITIPVNGISITDYPNADIYGEESTNSSYIASIEKEFYKIYLIKTSTDSVTFYAKSVPEIAFKVKLTV